MIIPDGRRAGISEKAAGVVSSYSRGMGRALLRRVSYAWAGVESGFVIVYLDGSQTDDGMELTADGGSDIVVNWK